jgi:2-oxoglutarate dehydrogenase E1 component
MGAWTFVEPRLQAVLEVIKTAGKPVRYSGRPPSASPATGLSSKHLKQRDRLLEEALGE